MTTVQGTIKDSVTGELIEFASILFEGTTVGDLSDQKGKFKISTQRPSKKLIVSLMGYETYTAMIQQGKVNNLEILLKPEGIKLDELVVRPGKEKYSKKDNPAVALIKKVIAKKEENSINSQSYYQVEEYDRLFFAINEFNEDLPQFRGMKFLSKYADSSKIDNKKILPFSLRETLSTYYYRKEPKATKRIVKAHKSEGIEQGMSMEAIDGVIKELFKDININDNNINMLFQNFVGPLSSHSSVDFYKWYIIDTVTIDQRRYVNLGFVPFNTRDVGFIGNLYVTADTTYAVKKVAMRVPRNANVNFVETMIVNQDFEESENGVWIPKESTMAMELSMAGALKLYIEKVKDYNDFVFNQPIDAIFLNPNPEIFISGYTKQSDEYWAKNRPPVMNKDYKVGDMVDELMDNKFLNILMKTINIFSNGYIPLDGDEEKNKLDIGTPLTFFSFNNIEGARFRLTAATTANFHKNLFLYGYGAYGVKDHRFKYLAEATWAFNKKKYHKDEFPKNNLTVAYKYDINALGQRFLQAERDNILMSFNSSRSNNVTYAKMGQVGYNREYHNGFSFSLSLRNQIEKPAGSLEFKMQEEDDTYTYRNKLTTTEVGFGLRYAPNEKFFQQRRQRRSLPSDGWFMGMGFTAGLKDVMGGDYGYQKLSLYVYKEFWVAPYGKIIATVNADKIWGQTSFPSLLTPNANSSYTIQAGAFNLLNPMEFVNDQAVSWDIHYRMGGWLLNRVPLLKHLHLREVFGFRGYWGKLSDRNNPEFNSNLLVLPSDVYSLEKAPYMEINIGVENILNLFRIDYVRRLNYLDLPDVSKDGIRVSFEFTF